VAEVLALVVADSALNALKCCCWPDRCVNQGEGQEEGGVDSQEGGLYPQ